MEELDVPLIDFDLTWREVRAIYLRSGNRLRQKFVRFLLFYIFIFLVGLLALGLGVTFAMLGDLCPHTIAMFVLGTLLVFFSLPGFIRDTSDCFDGVNF